MGGVVDSVVSAVGGAVDSIGSAVSNVASNPVALGGLALAGMTGGASLGFDAAAAASDAAQLASLGMDQATIADMVANSYGIDSVAAADIAGMASQGIGASQIASTVGANMGGAVSSSGGLGSILGTVGQIGQAVAPWAGMAQSAYQMANAGNYATAADPFRTQRPLYQGMLQNLMTNPQSFNQDPSYQWRFSQGMDAVNRGAAKSGLLGSGNRLTELMQYGQGMASTEYGNQFNRLSQLAGASTGQPGMAAQALYQIPQSNLSNIFSQLGNVATPQYQQNLSNLWS